MKRYSLYIFVLLFLTFLSGCFSGVELYDETEPVLLELITPTDVLPETIEFTATDSTEPTEPTAELEVDDSLSVESGLHQLRFIDDKTQEYMDYCLNVPDFPERNMPLVVFLHGAVEVGHVELLQDYGIVSKTKEIYGNDYPFLLLLPCTHLPGWTEESVSHTLAALIDSVCEEYEVDRQHIIITGHSWGAIGVWKMVSLYGDRFSAAVPVSCGIDEEIDYRQCAKVSIRAFCGTIGEDEKNFGPAMEKIVQKINDAGGNASFVAIDGADHEAMVTAAYTKELFDWMLSQ